MILPNLVLVVVEYMVCLVMLFEEGSVYIGNEFTNDIGYKDRFEI